MEMNSRQLAGWAQRSEQGQFGSLSLCMHATAVGVKEDVQEGGVHVRGGKA